MPTRCWIGRSRWPPSGVAPSVRGPVALLAGAVGCAYLNAFWGAFQFDDYNVIVQNAAVHSWRAWWDSLPGIRPLLKLSYTLNWSLGHGPSGFHAVNLLCHAASTLAVYAICHRFLIGTGGGPEARPAALAAALLFGLHPAQTEAVTYISGRSVSLMGVCYLGALLAHVEGGPRAGRWRAGLSPLLFAAALLVKETAWTLPFALLLWDRGAAAAGWRERLWRLRWHGGVLVLAAAGMLATAGYRRLLLGSLAARTLKENLLTQIDGQFYLLTQPLLWLRVNIDPDLPVRAALDPGLLLKAGLLAALAALGWVERRRRPWLGVGLLWMFLHLLPTNSILPRLDVANDRQLYLAMLGPALLAARLVWGRLPRPAAATATLLLALCLGVATVARNAEYESEVALWRATVRESPRKARAWNNLGYAHQLAGDVEAARQAYWRALDLDPAYHKARINASLLPPPPAPAPPR
jgi:protein O-mannosyl-transferase